MHPVHTPSDDTLLPTLRRGLTVLAAALLGFGLILWVAANWDSLGRTGQFAMLQGVVALACAAAWRPGALRPAAGLVAWLGIGGLFAYFGQTYQTGADPWQLFALWAVLGVPLGVAVRSDVLWAPWTLVFNTAVTLWMHQHMGHRWHFSPTDIPLHLLSWLAALGVTVWLNGWGTGARRWPWATRAAALQTTALVTGSALGGLFWQEGLGLYLLGLVLVGAATGWLSQPGRFDMFVLSALVLSFNTLGLAGLARGLFDGHSDAALLSFFFLTLVAAGSLAFSVRWLLGCHRAHQRWGAPVHPEPTASADTTAEPPAEPAAEPSSAARPWALVLFSAAGAWLVTLPALGFLGLLLGDVLVKGPGSYVFGAVLIGGALTVMRSRPAAATTPQSPTAQAFGEQLSLAGLLTGTVLLAFGLYRDLPDNTSTATALLWGVVALEAWAVPTGWLRALLGATLHTLAVWWLASFGWGNHHRWFSAPHHNATVVTIGLIQVLGITGWLVLLNMRSPIHQEHLTQKTAPNALEAIGLGWIFSSVLILCQFNGSSFLMSAFFHAPWNSPFVDTALPSRWYRWGLPSLSVALSIAALGWLWQRWPVLRQPWCLGVALVLTGLAWFMPSLGAFWLTLAVAVTTRHWRVAQATGLAVAWVIGAFYYQLSWLLAHKAAVLAGAGVLLGLLAWLAWLAAKTAPANIPVDTTVTTTATAASTHTSSASPAGTPPQVQPQAQHQLSFMPRWGALVTLALVLSVANVGIWQKEQLIARGRSVFVELAPADPRSLMEGDYMALNYRFGDLLRGQLEELPEEQFTALAVANLDAEGVATLQQLHTAGAPGTAESLPIELKRKSGRWTVVSDAWFFKEGTGPHWERARYGEFRVTPGGKALLVGLADDQRQRIEPVRELPAHERPPTQDDPAPAEAPAASAGQ